MRKIVFLWSTMLLCTIGKYYAQQTGILQQIGTFYYISGHVWLGTPINRIGIVAGTGVTYEHIQVYAQLRSHYQLTGWVKGKYTPEMQFSLGGLLTWGSPNMYFTHELLYQNFTPYTHAVGYTHHWYIDKVQTSQRAGSISLQVDKFSVILENDVLAGQGKDDFRTGGFKVAYQINPYHAVALTSILWTGQSRGAIRIDTGGYHARFGYKDLSNTLYGKQSKGILALQYSYFYAPLGITQVQAGIDAEQIRHVFQNKLIHDMPFFPRKWNKAENPHYPMLDTEGMPYINPEKQKIRKPKPYFQVGLNPSSFY